MMSLGGFSAIRITSCMHLTPSNNLGVKSNKKSSSKRLKKTDEKKNNFLQDPSISKKYFFDLRVSPPHWKLNEQIPDKKYPYNRIQCCHSRWRKWYPHCIVGPDKRPALTLPHTWLFLIFGVLTVGITASYLTFGIRIAEFA